MNFPTFINKWIIGYKPIMYSPFWWWWRLMSHEGFRFDDYHIWGSFWSSLSGGSLDMNYQAEFERIWGKGAKVEKTLISAENYDKLVEQLNQKPKPIPGLKELMNRKTPFENPND
jgi:hypothetical protein